MDPIKMGHISKEVHRTVPWLLCFEENWATAWVIKRILNQRVHDRKRAKRREREMMMRRS
jgi:hypothetical protein